MDPQSTTKAHCNSCGQSTRHCLIASRKSHELAVEGDENFNPIFIDYTHDFLHCYGCNSVTMRRKSECEPLWRDHIQIEYFPPAASRRRPKWDTQLPSAVLHLLLEVYLALHSDSRRLAMMGARTLVDIAVLDKVGDVGTFKEKLKALEIQGYIGSRNREFLAVALEAGNASVHRGHQFKTEEVNQVIDIVENLLQAIYILESTVKKLKDATPPRKH